MSNVVPISAEDSRLEAASRWVLKLDDGLTAETEAGLKAWLAEDPRHSAAFLEVAKAWDKLDSLSRLAELFPIHSEPSRPLRPAVWGRPRVWAATAGMLLLTAVVGYFMSGAGSGGTVDARSPAAVAASYETAVGEQKTVLLPDGSELVMNTNSRLRVAYTDGARVLHLVRGELHVAVAPDPARPFSVVAGDRIVQALGTEFSVQITERNLVEILVTEGKVVVGVQPVRHRSPSGPDEPQPLEIPPVLAQSEGNTVDAGQTLVLGVPDETVTALSADEIEVELSWKKGRLIFKSLPLAEALAEVERYTTVEFVLLDEELRTQKLSGRFRAGDVDTLLALLEANFRIGHEFDGEQRVLLSSL